MSIYIFVTFICSMLDCGKNNYKKTFEIKTLFQELRTEIRIILTYDAIQIKSQQERDLGQIKKKVSIR